MSNEKVVSNVIFYCPKCKTGELYIDVDSIPDRGCHEIKCKNCDFNEPI